MKPVANKTVSQIQYLKKNKDKKTYFSIYTASNKSSMMKNQSKEEKNFINNASNF